MSPPRTGSTSRHGPADGINGFTMNDQTGGLQALNFTKMPATEWPAKLRRALELLSDMPPDIQGDLIETWLDEIVPHHRLARRREDLRRQVRDMERHSPNTQRQED